MNSRIIFYNQEEAQVDYYDSSLLVTTNTTKQLKVHDVNKAESIELGEWNINHPTAAVSVKYNKATVLDQSGQITIFNLKE